MPVLPGALWVEARRARCYTNTANGLKWPPELELHQPRRVFSALLSYLSYLAFDEKWSDTPVLRRASPDPKSGGNAGSLVSENGSPAWT